MALFLAPNPNPHPSTIPRPRPSHFTPPLSFHLPPRPRLRLRLLATAAGEAVTATAAGEAVSVAAASSPPPEPAAAAPEVEGEKRRKLYVGNLPFALPAPEIEKLFAQCGTVKDVEVILEKDGRKKGIAFVTMATAAEAQAAVEKFNSYELMGRAIKVEFSKSFRKPAPPPPPGDAVERHRLYVSNLAWKARSANLKEFFSKFNPTSSRVVFDTSAGKSAGYGFVAFGTKEEAEAALTELDGKELMGRPVRVRWRVKADDDVEGEKADNSSEGKGVEE